jgi:conjugative transposon TraK protein
MFERQRNIETAFRFVRSFTLALISGCFLLCGFVLYKSYELSAKLENKMYVLAGDKALEAFASSRKDNIAVEARDHVRMFHTLFFSLDPDDKVIESNLSKALYLADGSAKKQYDALKETGYYAGIISGNISQQVTVDSVLVDTRAEPYLFRCYAILKIIRPTSIITRNLITQGWLRNIARSDHNAHGFLIERWETLENKDLKTEKR